MKGNVLKAYAFLLQVLCLFLTHVTINISINGCIPKSKYMYSVGLYSVLKGKL